MRYLKTILIPFSYIANFFEAEFKFSYKEMFGNGNGNSWYNNIVLKNTIKKYKEASRAIRKNPNDADNYYDIGKVLLQGKKYEEAIIDFTEAIKLKPDYYLAWVYRGMAYYELKEYNKAIENYDKAIEIKENDNSAYDARGHAYSAIGEHDKAIKDFAKVRRRIRENKSSYRVVKSE